MPHNIIKHPLTTADLPRILRELKTEKLWKVGQRYGMRQRQMERFLEVNGVEPRQFVRQSKRGRIEADVDIITDRLKSEPIVTVAKHYGVSSGNLKDIVLSLGVDPVVFKKQMGRPVENYMARTMRELAEDGLTSTEIAEEMNALGIEYRYGTPWTANIVAGALMARNIPFARSQGALPASTMPVFVPNLRWDFSHENIDTGRL